MTETSIFSFLLSAGLNPTGAAALMGNMYCESGLIANRLQGDFSPDLSASADYTRRVDSGLLSPSAFASDGRGYGLCQWTFPTRKSALLDFARSEGSSIGDAGMQLRFCVSEFPSEAPSTWEYLKTGTDLYTAADLICRNYERPEVCNSSARYAAALKYYNACASATPSAEPTTQDASASSPPASAALCTVSLPVLSLNSSGASVAAAQRLLTGEGFSCGASGADGIFGPATAAAVAAFQSSRGLSPDAVIGPATWAALLGA